MSAIDDLIQALEAIKQKSDGTILYAAEVHDLVDGIFAAMEMAGDVTVATTPIEGGNKITITDPEGVAHSFDVMNGVDGTDGADGAPGHNPNLGTYLDTDTNKPTSGQAGDYIIVIDTTVTPRAASVWAWNGSTFADTEKSVEDFGVQFASGQPVADVHIKDASGQEVTGSAGVLSAEAGQAIVERLRIISPEEQTINLKADVVWLEGYYSLDADGSLHERTDTYKTSDYIALPTNVKTINYKGGTATSDWAKQVAVYNNNNECLGTFFQYPTQDGGNVFDISNLVGATKMRISEYVNFISYNSWDIAAVTLITRTNQEAFEDFSQSVDDRFDEVDDRFDEVDDNLDEVDEQLENLDENYYLSDPIDVETNLKSDVVWLEGFYSLGADGSLHEKTDTYKTSDYIALPTNVKTINYKGGTATSDWAKQVAVYNNNNECLGTFFQYPTQDGGNVFDISNLVGATKMRISEYDLYVTRNEWDISITQNAQQTNKETYDALLDWLDSLNQWKSKKFLVFGASNTSVGFSDGTAWIQMAAERLKMQSPISGMASRRVSLKYIDGALNLVGVAATIAECQSINASTTISYETQFAKDFDCVLFGGFAGESYDESQVVIDGTTYYGGEELIDLIQLPSTRYNNNPHFTYSNGDTLAQHRDSYIGAVIYVLNELWTRKPTCRVVFTRAYLHWKTYDSYSKNFNGIKKLCDKLHLPFIDLSEGVYFNGFTTGNGIGDATNPNVYLYDGEHASLAGRQRLANIFTHRLLLLS